MKPHPEIEFFVRFQGGSQPAVPLLTARRLDIAFGRLPSLTTTSLRDAIAHRPVRFERIAVLLPKGHKLAALPAVPLEALRDAAVCWRAGTHVTPEWEDAALQLLAGFEVDPTRAHPPVLSLDELALHLRRRNAPVLTVVSQAPLPGAVVRPLVSPTAVYPWHMVWRRDVPKPGLRALNQAIDEMAATEHWLELPEDAWMPEPEASSIQWPPEGPGPRTL